MPYPTQYELYVNNTRINLVIPTNNNNSDYNISNGTFESPFTSPTSTRFTNFAYVYLTSSDRIKIIHNGTGVSTSYKPYELKITTNHFYGNPSENTILSYVYTLTSDPNGGVLPITALSGTYQGPGVYSISIIDIKDGTGLYSTNGIAVTKINTVGLIGAAVGGWDSDKVTLVKDPGSSLIYRASNVPFTGIVTDGFKIRTNQKWPNGTPLYSACLDIEYIQDISSGFINSHIGPCINNGYGGDDFTFTRLELSLPQGTYDVEFDMSDSKNMTLRIYIPEPPQPPPVEPEDLCCKNKDTYISNRTGPINTQRDNSSNSHQQRKGDVAILFSKPTKSMDQSFNLRRIRARG